MTTDSLKAYLGLFLIFLLVLALIDCGAGKTRYCPGQVSQHIYKPPYTTLSCHTDKKGHQTCHTEYHPAEFRLLVECAQPEHVASINTSMLNYALIHDGDMITVGERCGRWTHIVWTNWVQSRKVKADY